VVLRSHNLAPTSSGADDLENQLPGALAEHGHAVEAVQQLGWEVFGCGFEDLALGFGCHYAVEGCGGWVGEDGAAEVVREAGRVLWLV
jgi:hypothetical protein